MSYSFSFKKLLLLSIMSQYGGNYYKEQQPHPGQSPYAQTQGQYPLEQTQYAPPPYAEQAYLHGGQHTQT